MLSEYFKGENVIWKHNRVFNVKDFQEAFSMFNHAGGLSKLFELIQCSMGRMFAAQ